MDSLPSQAFGIVFDCPVQNDTCDENPDIAGLGVILSFVVAAIATTSASVAAAIIDGKLLDDSFLPLSCQQWLNRGQSKETLLRARQWRRVFERLVLSFTDQQLVTGFALLIAGYATVYDSSNNLKAHWSLVVYLSCLSSSTHLAGILTLRKYFQIYRPTIVLRMCLILSFSALVIAAISTSISFSIFFLPFRLILRHLFGYQFGHYHKGPGHMAILLLWYIFWTSVFLYVFYMAIIQAMPRFKLVVQNRLRNRAWPFLRNWLGLKAVGSVLLFLLGKRLYGATRKELIALLWMILFPGVGIVFAAQIAFTIIALVYSLIQKFATPSHHDIENGCYCSLNVASENQMGFGQILAAVSLLLPILTAWETYTGLPTIYAFRAARGCIAMCRFPWLVTSATWFMFCIALQFTVFDVRHDPISPRINFKLLHRSYLLCSKSPLWSVDSSRLNLLGMVVCESEEPL